MILNLLKLDIAIFFEPRRHIFTNFQKFSKMGRFKKSSCSVLHVHRVARPSTCSAVRARALPEKTCLSFGANSLQKLCVIAGDGAAHAAQLRGNFCAEFVRK